jgi:hypothetical protein
MHAISQTTLIHPTQTIFCWDSLQPAQNAIQPIPAGLRLHINNMIFNLSLFIQVNIKECGVYVLSAIQILPVTQFSVVSVATNIIKRVWMKYTRRKTDILITVLLALAAIREVMQNKIHI